MPYFFGIKTPLLEIRELQETANQISNLALPIQPVSPDSLHITILYIGKKLPKRDVLTRIEGELLKIGEIKLKITNKLEIFPSLSKPRALVLKVEDKYGKLREIRNILLNMLRQHNVTIEDRFLHDFNPHITIGHIRAKLTYVEAIEILDSIRVDIPDIELNVRYIELIDSTGGTYNVICRLLTLPQTLDQDTL